MNAKEKMNEENAIRRFKLPIFADRYLTIFAHHGLKEKPAVNANKAVRERGSIWDIIYLLCFIKGACTGPSFSVHH